MFLFSSAVTADAKQRNRPPFDLKRHEVSLSGAFFPGRYTTGYNYDMCPPVSSVESLYDSSKNYSKEYITDSWSLKYTYNFTRILAFSASVSYEGGWNKVFRRSDNKLISKEYDHYITPMMHFRVHWLNRRNVRMYSDAAVGVSANISDSSRLIFAGQFTAVGVTFGRKLFGFVECGAGTVYMGGCAGIGYRF